MIYDECAQLYTVSDGVDCELTRSVQQKAHTARMTVWCDGKSLSLAAVRETPDATHTVANANNPPDRFLQKCGRRGQASALVSYMARTDIRPSRPPTCCPSLEGAVGA